LRQVRPVRAQRAERGNQILRKLPGEPRPADARNHLAIDETRDRVAREPLVIAQQVVDPEVVHTIAAGCHHARLRPPTRRLSAGGSAGLF